MTIGAPQHNQRLKYERDVDIGGFANDREAVADAMRIAAVAGAMRIEITGNKIIDGITSPVHVD